MKPTCCWPRRGALVPILLCMFLVAPVPATATTYHLSAEGDDAWSGTLPEPNPARTDGPWRWLRKIWDERARFRPGDEILLRRGDVWNQAPVNPLIQIEQGRRAPLVLAFDGAPGQPITLGAYGEGDKPVIDGREMSTTNHSLIIPWETNWVTIQDLHLIPGDTTYHFIRFVTAHTDDTEGVSHVKVVRVDFDNSLDVPGWFGGHGICFDNMVYLDSSPSNFPEPNPGAPCHDVEISHCRFVGIGGISAWKKWDAINVAAPKGGRFWIHDNEFYHTNEAIDVAGDSGHVIEHNVIVATSQYQGIKVHSQFSHVSDTKIRGNVIVGAWGYAIAVENISNSEISHNTIYSVPRPDGRGETALYLGDMDFDPPEGYYGTFEGNLIADNVAWGKTYVFGALPQANIGMVNAFRNNAYWSPAGPEIVIGPTVIDESNFAAEWLSQPGVREDAIGDPRFVNPFFQSAWSFGDFHLAPGSPAIDSGLFVGLVRDIEGHLVPLGEEVDRGAYESAGELHPPGDTGVVSRFREDRQTFEWFPAPAAETYALYRGRIAESFDPSYNEACLAGGLTETWGLDAAVPPLGEAFWYDSSARNAAGEGPLGRDSSGNERPAPPACP